jgi:hypothetical protein
LILSSGEEIYFDWTELLKISDFFASMYGIGSCKSFSEFIGMINEEDPFIVFGLMEAASDRMKKMYGSSSDEVQPEISPEISNKKVHTASPIKTSRATPQYLMQFLRDFGASSASLEEAQKKISQGKIRIPEGDYSWITSKTLSDPNFDFKGTLEKMSKDRKNALNIRVSMDTLLNRGRKHAKR